MSTTPVPAIRAAVPRQAPTPRPGEAPDRSLRPAPLMRRVEIAALTAAGTVEEASRLIPSLPVFEEAFAAFARGTLLRTDRGLVAVEDLWPGMEVRTSQGRAARLLWRGSTMVVPQGDGQDPVMTRLTRIATEAFGFGRPFEDVVLGPRARIVNRRAGVRLLTGREAALIPAADFVDGVAAVEVTPGAPVEVFHLAFARHEVVVAQGLEVESFHPGPLHSLPLRGDQLSLFLSCFPHLPDLLAFGEPALPRLRLRDLDLFDAA